MGFDERRNPHDKIGLQVATKVLEDEGYGVFRSGCEVKQQLDVVHKVLPKKVYPTEYLLKYFPDIAATKDDSHFLLVEIKTVQEDERKKNYAIEADSYIISQVLAKNGNAVRYILIEITKDRGVYVRWCNLNDVIIDRIRVTERYDFDKERNRLALEPYFANVEYEQWPWNKRYSSGTSYFLIKKNSGFIKEWDEWDNF